MQMKNVLDRLTELAKDNPSPDVKQAMENTRRMSVVEDADVVEVHEGVAEGNIWHGTDSGSDEADNTDHNFEEATQYIKGAYPFHKTYNVYRAEPGFRALFNPRHFLKGVAHTEKVDSGLDQLQLKRNPMMSGGAQVSASIGYSWSVLENASTGIALLYYQDRGMGSDQVIIAAKDKQQLAGALGVFRDAGVIPDPSEMAARKAEKAAGRTAILQKKGLAVGVKFSERPDDGSNMYKITAITPSGKVKAVNLDTGQVRIWSPGSIGKGMLQTGLYPDEFDEPRQGVAEGGKTPKQYWNRDSQSIGSTPDDGLTYADPDEDGVHYPDYGNTNKSPRKRRVKDNDGFKTTDTRYRVDPKTKKLIPLHRISIENESVNLDVAEGLGTSPDRLLARTGMNNAHKFPRDGQTDLGNIPGMNTPGASPETNAYADRQRARRPGDLKAAISGQLSKHRKPNLPEQGVAEGHFSDQDVQEKDKQYAGTKAYHANKKAEKEKTATDAKTAFDTKFGGGNPASALKIREQSVTEGVNFAEMHRTKHTTLDEMLNELHDDINTFKQCGQMSEQLRDFMEVHHYGKKQLMDAAYGPVDELADMTKLAGVPGPIGQPDEELAESSGEMINGKEVDMYSLWVGGVDYQDSPEFEDAYFESGSFVDGTPLSDNELEQLTHERRDLVSELASEHLIGAGEAARDRQRDMDMELEGVNDGDNGLASAHAKARQISGEHGVGQHVNRDPDSGHHHCSDWYIDGETVGSYNMGKRYDDSGYIDEEEMMPGEESDVAQKAQGIEAVSGKKINQMNPGEIKMAGQKVDAMGVTESKQMVDECGMMGDSMQPNTPANINISASAASGGEVAAMINDLLRLAGRPENADAHMDEPGVVAIDGTMDAGGAEELAAMLGGEEVVDETGDAGGFADATTQPDALVYDQNPVLTQTGVQKHTLGGYHNGDSPLAATTELEESLWRKFQNQ